MWFERFVIANTTLSRDFLPSSWGYYSPTVVDILPSLVHLDSFLFSFLFLFDFLPLMPMAEVKSVMPAADPHGGKH